MQFNARNLGDRFKHTIDWMIEGRFGQEIKRWLKTYQRQQSDLLNDADAESALKLLVETKLTNSFYRPLPEPRRQQFQLDFDSIIRKHVHNLRTSQAKDELTSLIVNYSILRIAEGKAKEWVEKLLGDYPTLRDFTEELYSVRRNGKKGLLENKGADHYLRDVGHWDIIPIDVHERRFLVRTGIFHTFSLPGRQDPLGYGSLQDALSTFCLFCLQGKIFEGVDLSSRPGIVDLFIWFYCADKKYEICGSTPKCGECGLNDACLYGLASIQNAIARGQTMQEYGLSKENIDQLLQQVPKSRPSKPGGINWSSMRQWAQDDPDGLALSLKQYGMSRSHARAFLKKAGLIPDEIKKILTKVYDSELESEQ